MSIAYSNWPPGKGTDEQPARKGMAAYLEGHGLAVPPRHRWKSMAISIAGHGAFLYAVLFATSAAPKKQEMQTITVSITPAQASKPEPMLMPKLERVPDVIVPKLPQIDTAAPPSPNAIQAAPPPAAPVSTDSAKLSEAADTTPPRFDAGYLNNPAPVYPNMSRRLREVGIVQLRVRVSTGGEPLEIQLAKSSGYSRLDDSARAAVQKWKFQPAKRNGTAVEAWVIVPIEFSLTRR